MTSTRKEKRDGRDDHFCIKPLSSHSHNATQNRSREREDAEQYAQQAPWDSTHARDSNSRHSSFQAQVLARSVSRHRTYTAPEVRVFCERKRAKNRLRFTSSMLLLLYLSECERGWLNRPQVLLTLRRAEKAWHAPTIE